MISIIIPTRNEEKIIERTLKTLKDSIKRTPYEIIIADGSSTDKTVEIARKYADKVVIQADTKTRTIGQGKNLGAGQASGEYFLFFDADLTVPDIDDVFEKIIGEFNKDKKLVAVTIAQKILPEYETTADRTILSFYNRYNATLNNVFGVGAAPGEFQFIKADVFKAIGGYNEKIVASEDLEMFSRLAKTGRTFFDINLRFFHTGRRVHKIGWPRLLWQWNINGISVLILKRSIHKEWKVIR